VISAWREYCAVLCVDAQSILARADLVTEGVATTAVEHVENHTQYSVIRFRSDDVPANTEYYTALHAKIRIEYSLGGQRRSVVVQTSSVQQSQALGFMLQRGPSTSTSSSQSVQVSLVLLGDMRPMMADAHCAREWSDVVKVAVESKLGLLLEEPASRFLVNVTGFQESGAALSLEISPIHGQPDTILTTRLENLIKNSSSELTLQITACNRAVVVTLSSNVFFVRNPNNQFNPARTRSSFKVWVVGVAGGAFFAFAFVLALACMIKRHRGKGTTTVEEHRAGSGGITYRSVHIDPPTDVGDLPPQSTSPIELP